MHIQDKNDFNNFKKIIHKWRKNWTTGATHFDCHWKSMETRVGMENLVLTSQKVAIMHLLFQIYKKRSLTCRDTFLILTWHPPIKRTPLTSTLGYAEQLCRWTGLRISIFLKCTSTSLFTGGTFYYNLDNFHGYLNS
jgi:hypothetical protein